MPLKLMLLGGSAYLIPVIREAHDMGIYVITVDYLPNNIAHQYSDEYCNISVVNKEKVLHKAIEIGIDGILSFANDPGVLTAAYVAEQMNLPFPCSYETAKIFQDKGLFQDFLKKHSFNARNFIVYDKESDISKFDVSVLDFPVMVKPIDSSGSKGVIKVASCDDLYSAIEESIQYSLSGSVIIEDFVDLDNYQSSSDIFVIDGRITYAVFDDQLFGENDNCAFVPIGHIIPSSNENLEEFTETLQKLFYLLKVRTGLFNVEIRRDKKGRVFIMEVSPRGGGNHMAYLQQLACENNILKCEILQSVGQDPSPLLNHSTCKGVWVNYVIHTMKSGNLRAIEFADCLKMHNICTIFNIEMGDKVSTFDAANKSLGTIFLNFSDRNLLDEIMSHIDEYVNVIL